ncbi:MAG: agmatinase [Phycisphaerales bacterium]|nr:agmatinase [Phycisphaerales bacterium]
MPTQLPSGRVQPRFAGISTFMRFPRLSDLGDDSPPDWIVFGAPFDGGTTFHPGARFGPRAIRDASQYLKPASIELEVDLSATFSLADGGDSPVAAYSCSDNLELLTTFAQGLGQSAQSHLLALGGDHSISLANIRVAWERAGRPATGLAAIIFDAHLDTVDTVWDESYGHASFLRRAIEDGCVDAARTLIIGVRGSLNTLDDLQFAHSKHITLVPMSRFIDDFASGERAVLEFRDRIGDAPVYLSCDVDAVDPAFAPGTGTPVCGGFTSAQMLGILRRFQGAQVVGADVVEVCPARDLSANTAMLAAQIAFEILCLDAVGR